MNDRQINAFALPGGYIGVNTGLLLAAQGESEVASVIAHEVAHVTQRHIARILDQQKQSTVLSLAALAVAVLAARANSDLGAAATAFGQGAAIQNMLNFTRDHEREADRVGVQTLEGAGFDPRAMVTFFERMQRATRVYKGACPPTCAPTRLRTSVSPTSRIGSKTPIGGADSLDFQLVRAKLKADLDPPNEARAFFEGSLTERRFLSEAASRYGLATSLLRQKSVAAARKEFDALKRIVPSNSMVDSLGCRIRGGAGDTEGAIDCYRTSAKAYPQSRAINYGTPKTQLVQAQRADML